MGSILPALALSSPSGAVTRRRRDTRLHGAGSAEPVVARRADLALHRARPGRLGGARPVDAVAAPRDRDRAAPRPRRAARPARGRRGLPAAQPPAQPLRRRHEVAARRRRASSCASASSRTPFVIGVAGSVAVGKSTIARLLRELLARWERHAPGRARHDRRLPVPERRARAARADGAQGLPRVLRPSRAAAVRQRGEGGRRRGARAVLLAPRLRHRARRADHGAPARRAHRRGPQRAAAAAARATGSRSATSSTSRSTSTPARATSRAGTRSGSSSCSAARSRTRARTSTATRASPRTRRAQRAREIWHSINEPNLLQNIRPDALAGIARAAQERRSRRVERAAPQALSVSSGSRLPSVGSGENSERQSLEHASERQLRRVARARPRRGWRRAAPRPPARLPRP